LKGYKIAVVKQIKKKAAGLANATMDDFEVRGQVCQLAPIKYVLVKHKGKFDKNGRQIKEGIEYTLKVRSKTQLVEMNMQARLRSEMKLLTMMSGSKLLMPLPLQTIEDDSYIYSVLPTKVACMMSDLIDENESLDEDTCRFFAAVLAEAIQCLHDECPTTGGILYRNLDPASITLDENGWPQLLDMRFATAAEPPPRDFCGQVHYFSPEQVSGNGHGVQSDFWALGIFIYEMITGSNPWLTGDAIKDSELNIFGRITGHKRGELKFPADMNISIDLAKLLNELLEPNIDHRLGCKMGKLASNAREQVRKHKWFEGFKWEELSNGTLVSPAKMFCQTAINKATNKHLRETQIVGLFDEVYVPTADDGFGEGGFEANETSAMNFKAMNFKDKTLTWRATRSPSRPRRRAWLTRRRPSLKSSASSAPQRSLRRRRSRRSSRRSSRRRRASTSTVLTRMHERRSCLARSQQTCSRPRQRSRSARERAH